VDVCGSSFDGFKSLPEAWKDKPELLKLAHQHQDWMGHAITERLRKIVARMMDVQARETAAASVNSEISSEKVRVLASQLQTLISIEKVIYDTEKFVEHSERAGR